MRNEAGRTNKETTRICRKGNTQRHNGITQLLKENSCTEYGIINKQQKKLTQERRFKR